jgi:hypothetical protein
MKKVLVALLLLCLGLGLLIGCGKPKDIDQKIYDLEKKQYGS